MWNYRRTGLAGLNLLDGEVPRNYTVLEYCVDVHAHTTLGPLSCTSFLLLDPIIRIKIAADLVGTLPEPQLYSDILDSDLCKRSFEFKYDK